MNDNFDDVESFVKSVMQNVSVVTYPLLCKMIENKFCGEVTTGFIELVLRRMQSHNSVLISKDNYVMTMGAYITITDDIWCNRLDKHSDKQVPLGIDYSLSRDGTEIIDCLWFLASMLPYVSEYVINSPVWNLQFIVPPDEGQDAKLYQVAKFTRGFEKAKSLLIANTGMITDIVYREQVRRIALFDDESMAFITPEGLGFNIIAVVDENRLNHYRILEKRTNKEAW